LHGVCGEGAERCNGKGSRSVMKCPPPCRWQQLLGDAALTRCGCVATGFGCQTRRGLTRVIPRRARCQGGWCDNARSMQLVRELSAKVLRLGSSNSLLDAEKAPHEEVSPTLTKNQSTVGVASEEAGGIRIAVRVRPFNKREAELRSECCVSMPGGGKVMVERQKDNEHEEKTFKFDFAYWSHDKVTYEYADQDLVFRDIGRPLLEQAEKGFNACIFAYGQTGAGKSYSMTGSPASKDGIIPKICAEVFERTGGEGLESVSVTVTLLEIYSENMRDRALRDLDPSTLGLAARHLQSAGWPAADHRPPDRDASAQSLSIRRRTRRRPSGYASPRRGRSSCSIRNRCKSAVTRRWTASSSTAWPIGRSRRPR
jgi:hypothetical protein